MKAQIGMLGLAVMGRNLTLNIRDKGFKVAVYEYSEGVADDFVQSEIENTAKIETAEMISSNSLKEFVDNLEAPRIVFMMVRAGEVVDFYIDQLVPLLSEGDIIVDGGNSLYTDTNRRVKDLSEKGLIFIGMGVSGGEEGAHYGASLMPGGNSAGWERVKPIFQTICAKVDNEPCCHWVGDNGAGHYVKMVHNGIEYGDMQLISETYQLLTEGLNLSIEEVREIFIEWNKGDLNSYLMEITADILSFKDMDGAPLLTKILDTAGQKGTGKWTGIDALELGIPLTLIGEAVFARCLSWQKAERVQAAKIFARKPVDTFNGDKAEMIRAIHDALYASKLISYAQGFRLMREASKEYDFALNYGDIALMWRGGCIIRSKFLSNIKQAYSNNHELENLLFDEFFTNVMKTCDVGWRKAVVLGIQLHIPTPTFSSALSYFDGYLTEKLPASLLQAQRDYFGAHSYERIDKPRGQFFHTDWMGKGEQTASNTYSV